MENKPEYWFPAKTYGWGWGLPTAWQGWLVMLAAALGQLGVALRFPPTVAPVAFTIGTVAVVVSLILVCFAKGEPPGWCWGGK
jgi:hypothetical protein